MTKIWEYRTVDLSGVEFDRLQGELAGLAGQGWEIMPQAEAKVGLPTLHIILRRRIGGGVDGLAVASPAC